MKRMVCLVLTVMLVVTSLTLVPTSASAYAVSPIRFKDNLKWDSFYVYQWDSDGTEYAGQWPGTPLQPVETTDEYNLYEIFPDYSAEGFIINNGTGLQTFDIPTDQDVYGYTFTGKTSVEESGRMGYEIAEITREGKIAEPDDVKYFYISKKPEKLNYCTGEAFDPTGLEISIEYYNGDTEIIKDITSENFAEKNLALKEFSTKQVSNQTVRIAYTDKKGEERIASFKVKVVAEPVKLELVGMPDTNAIVGEPYLASGLKVRAIYENGKQELVPLEYNPNAPVVWINAFYNWKQMLAVAIDENGKENTLEPFSDAINDYGESLLAFVFPPSATSAYFTDGDNERTETITNLNGNYYPVNGKSENGEWMIAEWQFNYVDYDDIPMPVGAAIGKPDDAIRSCDDYQTEGYTLSKLEQKAGRQTVTVTYRKVSTTFDVDVFEKGDVNRDFSMNVVDVTAIQKIVAEMMTPDRFEQRLSDLSGDGKIDVTDATLLQLTIAGI